MCTWVDDQYHQKIFLKSMHWYGTSREHCVYQEISKFDLVSTIVFEVNNIFRVIGFLWNGPIELIKQKSQIFLYYCQILYYEREFFETVSTKIVSTRKALPGIIRVLEIFVVNMMKFIALFMILWLSHITLSCWVFITDVYISDFTRVNYTINIFRNTY